MTTAIRDFGDKKTIVVHTDERELATRLMNRKDCLKVVPYEQEQYSQKRVTLVGLDLYFSKKIRQRIEKIIRSGSPETSDIL